MIKVKIKCYSQVKYALGKDEISLELEPETTTEELEELVREQAREQLEGISLLTAVNRIYVPEPVVVQDGDEVAFIPPVQGG